MKLAKVDKINTIKEKANPSVALNVNGRRRRGANM
jgi:hypothetical protein